MLYRVKIHVQVVGGDKRLRKGQSHNPLLTLKMGTYHKTFFIKSARKIKARSDTNLSTHFNCIIFHHDFRPQKCLVTSFDDR